MYAAEVLAISPEDLEEVQLEQNKVGKAILGVPYSTANDAIPLLLGLKSITHLVAQQKIRYIIRLNENTDSAMLRICWKYHQDRKNTVFYKRSKAFLQKFALDIENLHSGSVQEMDKGIRTELLTQLSNRSSLKPVLVPVKWWHPLSWISTTRWSRALTRTLVMNLQLGNRSDVYKNYAPHVENGRIIDCPICNDGPNNEIHLIVECKSLSVTRRSIILSNGHSIQYLLTNGQYETAQTSDGKLRLFLGLEDGLRTKDYVERGLAIIEMVNVFFNEWSNKVDRQVPRPTFD